MVFVAALGAALLFALASVLQHRSARRESHDSSMRASLIGRLVKRPVWVMGVGADVGAYILQFIALATGSLVLVQPLLVSGLLFALPLAAALNRRRLHSLEWLGAAGVVVGLAAFLVVANPAPGRDHVSQMTWIVVFLATLVPAAVMLLLAGPGPSPRRAVLLAAATGTAYGLCAALTKATAALLSLGIVHLLTGWETYALLVVGAFTLLTAQSAFQAGPLRDSLPTLTVVDPVVSILIGAVAFGEHISTRGINVGVEVVSLAVMAAGVVLLARSPLVAEVVGEPAAGAPTEA